MANPQFVSPLTNDYNLQPGSPCADAGHEPHFPTPGLPGIPPDVLDLDENGNTTPPTPYDLVKGNRRERDDSMASDTGVDDPLGNVPGKVVDMGAHESVGN